MAKKKKNTLLPEVSKFALIGVLNTLIDFAILNVLNLRLGFPKIGSNIISTSVAMTFSFFANRTFVFQNKSKDQVKQAVLFVLVTAAGLWGLQSAVFWFFGDFWRWPIELAISIFSFLPADFIEVNGIKAVATAFSMVWNFVLYKKVVFTDDKPVKKTRR